MLQTFLEKGGTVVGGDYYGEFHHIQDTGQRMQDSGDRTQLE
jgi:hypothetical protein